MEWSKERILTLAVIFSIVGVSTLYAFTNQTANRDMDISEINEEHVGSRVSTEGTISDVSWLGYTVLFELKEKEVEESLTMVTDRDIIDELDEKEELVPGAKVSVEGKLEEYEKDYQLRIDSQGEISVEKEACSDFTPISEILENPSWFEGMMVKIQGDLKQFNESNQISQMNIVDFEEENYEITCEMDTEINEKKQDILGNPVVLEGEVIYDSNTGTWIIIVSGDLDFK